MILHEIRTERLLLRRARIDDLQDLHRVFTAPDAMRYWSVPPHETLDQSRAALEGLMRALPPLADDFVIEHKGRVIGKAGFWELPELGFLLHPDWWRQGLMREALGALIPHGFACHNLPYLTAEADPRNAPCLALLQGFGFRITHSAERTLLWGDEWCDSVYLRLDRPGA